MNYNRNQLLYVFKSQCSDEQPFSSLRKVNYTNMYELQYTVLFVLTKENHNLPKPYRILIIDGTAHGKKYEDKSIQEEKSAGDSMR